MRWHAGWLVAVVLAGPLAACHSPVGGGTWPIPRFQLVNAHWLLCPSQGVGLAKCCPQPSDPRRCVVPTAAGSEPGSVGSAPTKLVAFGRFKNAGAAGRATATFSNRGSPRAECSTTLPFTPAGAITETWCSLGSAPEDGPAPDVVLDNRVIDEQ
jgi:hypothetical protein